MTSQLASVEELPRTLEKSCDFNAVRERGLAGVDRLCQNRLSSGPLVLHGSVGNLTAAVNHARRRLAAAGRVFTVVGANVDEPMRELAARVEASTEGEPADVARAILDRAGDAALLVVRADASRWGTEVARELVRAAHVARALAVVGVTDPSVLAEASAAPRGPTSHAPEARLVPEDRVCDVEGAPDADELRRYFRAIADEAASLPGAADELEVVDRWWRAASATPFDRAPTLPSLSDGATALLRRLALARRSLAAAEVTALASPAARDELCAKQVAHLDDSGRLTLDAAACEPPLADVDADPTDLGAVAQTLDAATDAWGRMRAAELWASAGHRERAERAFESALEIAEEPSARDDLWARWEGALDRVDRDGALALAASEHALRVGDADRAVTFARAAAARHDSFEVLCQLGQALCARGELRHATISLERALAAAETGAERARCAVELGEVAYLEGRHADVETYAQGALADTRDASTLLGARNLLGKLLLARAEWARAEQHFAEDAWEAVRRGDLVAELRARVNGAIALLSSGRRDEARAALTAVLDDASQRRELPAVGYALSNLATLAILGHDYAEALRLTEEAAALRRRLGDRVRLSLLVANLAELRLRVGLVSEAEHALRFGRRVCSGSLPGSRFPQFALIAARIHLARGRTIEAASELRAALACPGSSNGAKLAECHRAAARVALEDGDLERAETSIALADKHGTSAETRAEVALLRALLGRARGDDFTAAAEQALRLAREAEDVELAREAHVLAFFAHRDADPRRASQHLDAARALRDRVSTSLPEPLRGAYLARRELATLGALLDADGCGLVDGEDDPSAPESGGPDSEASLCPATLRRVGARRSSRPPSSRGERGPTAPALERMVGSHPHVVTLRRAIERMGATDATVLVQGESGTGKELVAEALHEASARRDGPLVKVNCAALVETLLLSELFGHEKGAFTGASARRRGRFEMAEGGTLFLDEIGDISPRTQVALLRVLQEKTFERVGGVAPIHADVRVVCATHRDLRAMVQRGEFREDLYYRLRGLVLEVPALRHRVSDIPAIADETLRRIAEERGTPVKRLSPDARAVLASHAWPGNVRELENVLRAASVFAEGDAIEPVDFDTHLDRMSTPAAASAPAVDGSTTDVAYREVKGGVSLGDLKRRLERDCIARALDESGGNITRAATLLGMKRPRLSQLVKQHGLRSSEEV